MKSPIVPHTRAQLCHMEFAFDARSCQMGFNGAAFGVHVAVRPPDNLGLGSKARSQPGQCAKPGPSPPASRRHWPPAPQSAPHRARGAIYVVRAATDRPDIAALPCARPHHGPGETGQSCRYRKCLGGTGSLRPRDTEQLRGSRLDWFERDRRRGWSRRGSWVGHGLCCPIPTSRAQSMRTSNLICAVEGSAYFSRCPLESPAQMGAHPRADSKRIALRYCGEFKRCSGLRRVRKRQAGEYRSGDDDNS